MTIQIHGDAPGVTTSPTDGTDTTLYRFELIGGALVRKSPGDAQPCAEADRYLIDVLVNEVEPGRYLNGVRGVIVPKWDRGRPAPAPDLPRRRTFKVGIDMMLAIGKNLAVGPRLRTPPRLATLDGQHVG